MSALFALIASLEVRFAAAAAKLGLSTAGLALLGPLTPIISGVAQFLESVQ